MSKEDPLEIEPLEEFRSLKRYSLDRGLGMEVTEDGHWYKVEDVKEAVAFARGMLQALKIAVQEQLSKK